MHQVGGMGIHRWQLMIIWDNTLSVPVVYLDLSANSRLLIGIAMSVEKKKTTHNKRPVNKWLWSILCLERAGST